MPLPTLWRLQADKSRKLLITGVFVCGYRVIVVFIGRLVTVAKAGSALEEDLTWSTIPYIEWVQCEGPASVVSISLPTILTLSKRIHTHDLRSVLRGGKIPSEKPYSPGSVNGNNKLVRMDTCRRSPLCGGKPEE
ncbi:hypothetical protein ABVK25_001591 [Lepraria finkii]|uniref:Rhodopsin domain-containing protein n=1 Tax=Lepraria finkii TaxID=1340010 RepID=A0ABR4BJI6_9LECA